MARRKQKIAIIGFGHIAPTAYLGALVFVPEFKLVAVVDKNPAVKVGVPSSVSFYTDIEEMLCRKEADAVVVAVPQSEHYSVAKRCLESGLDVLLEKPATETMVEFESLVEIANKCGKVIVFNAHAAFGLDVRWFREHALTHQVISALGGMNGFHAGFYDPYVVDGKLSPSGHSLGGSWRDSGVNALCTLEALNFFDFEGLMMEQNLSTKGLAPYEDQGCAHFSFAGSGGEILRGTIDTNWTTGKNLKFTEVYYCDGSAVLLNHSDERIVFRDLKGDERLIVDCRNGRPRLVNHYIGVFQDFAVRLKQREGNADTSRGVHKLYFEFYERPSFGLYGRC